MSLSRFAQASLKRGLALVLAGVVSLGIATPLLGKIDAPDLIVAPEAKHERAIRLINQLISRYHYKGITFDDTLSRQVLDNYLQSLDPNRSYFLAKDIEQFDRYQDQFDDYLKDKKLEPAYAIYSIFRTRVDQRVNQANMFLDMEFDFERDETFQFDRSEAEWAVDEKALDEIWRKRVKNDILTLRLAGKDESEIKSTLQRRYEQLSLRTKQLNADDVFQYFMNAYMTAIEPHTSYFSPRTSENFQIRMSLSLEGIGAVLQLDNEYTTIRRVVPGGPAELSGQLKAGDRIIGVGQGEKQKLVDVIGWRLDDVVDLIRGPKGTSVRLEILPDETGHEGPSKIVSMKREQIKLEEQAAKKSIHTINKEGKDLRIGVIDVPMFYTDFAARARGDKDFRSTTRDVHRLLDELNEEKVDGLIIDLRGNGGGALSEAISVTGLFIEEGPIVQVKNSRGEVEISNDPDPEIAYEGPLAVLVDRNSASASEIFAAAIQDYRRGLIIGETTFGKGTVQNLIGLDRFSNGSKLGQIKVTIAQFFRINGGSTQHRGVIPDIEFPAASFADDEGERALVNALPWSEIETTDFAVRADIRDSEIVNDVHAMYAQRAQNDPRFDYYVDEMTQRHTFAEKTMLSLRESTRIAERDKQEKQQQDLEKALAALVQNNRKGENEEEGQNVDQLLQAILLDETENILSDFIIDTRRYLADNHNDQTLLAEPLLQKNGQMTVNSANGGATTVE